MARSTLPTLESLREELQLDSAQSGPKGTRSLRARGSSLAPPAAQLRVLNALPLARGDFDQALG